MEDKDKNKQKENAKQSLLMRLLKYSPAREKINNAPTEKYLDRKKIKKFKFGRK